MVWCTGAWKVLNPKTQIPNPKEIPIFKPPRRRSAMRWDSDSWALELHWDLGFGIWELLYGVVRFRDTPTYSVFLALLLVASLGATPKRDRRSKPEPAPLFPVEPAWAFMLESPPSAPGTMDDHRVYIPLLTGEIVALDRETGDFVWTATAESSWPPLVVADV